MQLWCNVGTRSLDKTDFCFSALGGVVSAIRFKARRLIGE